MSELRYYFDESIELVVSEQLAAGGLDVVSAHSLDQLGDSDPNHLARAARMERVLCTYDQDFLRLSAAGMPHHGIFFARHRTMTIGHWVRQIRALHTRMQAEDVVGQVIYLSSK